MHLSSGTDDNNTLKLYLHESPSTVDGALTIKQARAYVEQIARFCNLAAPAKPVELKCGRRHGTPRT